MFRAMYFTFAFLLCSLLSVPLCAADATGNRLIGNVMSAGALPHYTAVVDKKLKKIYILEISGDTERLLESADVMLGRAEGSKLALHDGKTPEGVYYIISHITQKELLARYGNWGKMYGIAAYPTNYPNPIDRIMQRTGGGIWLHGFNPDERDKPITQGCVALLDEDLARIQKYVYIGMPIVIIDDAQMMTSAEYKATREKHLSELNRFIAAWNSADYDTFKGYVHPQYSSYSGWNAQSYLDKKRQLMAQYPNKLVKLDNVNIYRQNATTLVYDFNQFYCADNMITYGHKKFYLVYDNGSEKLISEEMRMLSATEHIKAGVDAFLADWLKVWTSADIDKYMAFYDMRFPRRAAWEESKRDLFSKSGKIAVNISDVSHQVLGGNAIIIRFKQDYISDINADKGMKTLVITGCPGSFKIKSEDWRAR
ncbi:L,D-transpeptidase family protein [Deferribacterales bacterium RsTz2092]|nr:hypothetical protein AGMMS49941_06660 [Deferribacterales bacterium]